MSCVILTDGRIGAISQQKWTLNFVTKSLFVDRINGSRCVSVCVTLLALLWLMFERFELIFDTIVTTGISRRVVSVLDSGTEGP